MNVLVVGRGGREHSLVMKISESKLVDKIFVAPGNGGMENLAECVDIDELDLDGLVKFAKEKEIDLTVVGPENPLNEGIADCFMEAGLKVFAPTKKAALLEGSKSYAKEFMKKYNVPTADYAVFSDADEAKTYIKEHGAPIVVKADGLAAGKGVIVAMTEEEALDAVDYILVSKAFAEAGATVVIEEFLDGEEFSLMAFVRENKVYPMVTARDHKRAYDNDKGPNTGGMGAFAPATNVGEDDLTFAYQNILLRTAEGMIKEDRPFTGVLYAGLIMTKFGPKVIEFNTRFGDPETQVVLPLMKNDIVQVFLDVLDGKDPELEWKDEACLGVVVASAGYPGVYEKGIKLPELPEGNKPYVVHAGSKKVDGELVSDGGRVLLVGAVGESMHQAAEIVYKGLKPIENREGFFFRKDIGK